MEEREDGGGGRDRGRGGERIGRGKKKREEEGRGEGRGGKEEGGEGRREKKEGGREGRGRREKREGRRIKKGGKEKVEGHIQFCFARQTSKGSSSGSHLCKVSLVCLSSPSLAGGHGVTVHVHEGSNPPVQTLNQFQPHQ